MNEPEPAQRAHSPGSPVDFSIVLGGPLFQLLRRAHLADDALGLVRLRILVISLLAWLPLLMLCCSRRAPAGRNCVAVPFLKDVEVHARFLVVIPLLILAEFVVHRRMRPLPQQFLERNSIPEDALPRFEAAIASAFRLRNSMLAEALAPGLRVWRRHPDPLAPVRGARHEHLVCDALRGRARTLVGRTVVRLREHAGLSVPAVPLVLQIVHLGPLSVAGVAPRVAPGSDPSGSRWRPEFSFRVSPLRSRCSPWPTAPWWPDRSPAASSSSAPQLTQFKG